MTVERARLQDFDDSFIYSPGSGMPESAALHTLMPPHQARLLSMLAHELRAPLCALATSSELLDDDLELMDRQQVRRTVSTIRRGTIWMQGLVENLLCAATMRDGQLRIQPRPTSLVDVIREVRAVVEPLLAHKNHRLRFSTRGVPPMVWADGRRIGQVLVNLILNAQKLSDRGLPIEIGLAARSESVRVTVADRGPGLPSAAGGRLFEPFYRASTGPSSSSDGVGLGLAIVKSIVEAHGGRVGADNRRGGGARFWFDLPVLPIVEFPIPGLEVRKDVAV